MKTHSLAIIIASIIFISYGKVQAGIVESDSTIKNVTEYYFQTDKAVYNLGENNPGSEFKYQQQSTLGLHITFINDVYLIPQQPTINDIITIVTSGIEGGRPVVIEGSNFERNGTSLQLDIDLFVGPYAMVTPWSHSEVIGTLSAGLYDLTVRTFEDTDVLDTYLYEFEVTPEPATVLLLVLGAIGIRTSNRRKLH